MALRSRIESWLTPETSWPRVRNGVHRHPKRNALLLALSFVILFTSLWEAVRARTVGGAILHLVNAAAAGALAWYLWRIRQDAHRSEPPSWWR